MLPAAPLPGIPSQATVWAAVHCRARAGAAVRAGAAGLAGAASAAAGTRPIPQLRMAPVITAPVKMGRASWMDFTDNLPL